MEINPQQIEALQAALRVVFNQADTSTLPLGMLLPPASPPSEDPEQKERVEDVLQRFLNEEASSVTPEEVIRAMGPERPPQKPWFSGHKAFPQKPF